MEQEKIVQFITTNFTHQRQELIPKLQAFTWDDAIVSSIYKDIICDVERPVKAFGDISESVKKNLGNDPVDPENLGDISEIYTIVLNPEIGVVDDWDFTEELNNGREIISERYIFCQVFPRILIT